MDDVAIARAFHIVGIVMWIGGVSMVTTVILPAIRRFKSAEEKVEFFASVENRFAWQARFTTLITGLSGFYMVYAFDLWDRYLSLGFWWMHAMTAVWVIFTLVLFVFEPLFLNKWFQRSAKSNPEKTFAIIQTLHWVLLTISLVTVAGAVFGAHT